MHTVQTYLIAARERLTDAQILFAEGRNDACCYLSGYVVEMLLKHAAMTVAGAAPTDSTDLWRSYFWITFVKSKAISASFHSGHGLGFWAAALDATRRNSTLGPLAKQWQRRLHAAVQTTGKSWTVDMRYDGPSHSATAASALLSAAGWLLNNHMRLVRKRGRKCL